ncbi:MAG: hypothetical protein J7L23_00715 [Candidatus Diapherotrites archaeon]|nr:hypothetical protein [Candidatus Diapherotrites archaeon]
MARSGEIELYDAGKAREHSKIIKKKYSFFSPERRMSRIIEKRAKRVSGKDIWGRVMAKVLRPHEREVITEEGITYFRSHRPIFSRIRTEEDQRAYQLQTGKEKKIGQFAWGWMLDRGHDKLKNETIMKLAERRLTELMEEHERERESLTNKIRELEEKLKEKEQLATPEPTPKVSKPKKKKTKSTKKPSRKKPSKKKAQGKPRRKPRKTEGIVLSETEMKKLRKITSHSGYLQNLDGKDINEARKILEKHRDKLLTPSEMIDIEAMRNAINNMNSRLDSHKEPTYIATKSTRPQMFSAVRRLYKRGLTDVLGKKIAGGQAREIEEKTGLKLPKSTTEMRELDRVVHEIFRGGRTGRTKELRDLTTRASDILYSGETKLLAKRLAKIAKPKRKRTR